MRKAPCDIRGTAPSLWMGTLSPKGPYSEKTGSYFSERVWPLAPPPPKVCPHRSGSPRLETVGLPQLPSRPGRILEELKTIAALV